MASGSYAFQLSCTASNKPTTTSFDRPKATLSSLIQPILIRLIPRIPSTVTSSDLPKAIKETSLKLLDVFVDHVFEFVDQPYLPSQSNFAPVSEIGESAKVTGINGSIPDDFPEGVYFRNGGNPIHGGLKSTVSIFGKSSQMWAEGQGMIHALYLSKENNKWSITYKNKYVATETLQVQKQRKNSAFLPGVEGNSAAVLSGLLLNLVRFGMENEHLSNTSVFEHAGKCYTITENHMPYEIDMPTLETLGYWDGVRHSWNRPFTSHPKKAPGTGELVTFGTDAKKPYMELGVISADGLKLIHRVDLKFNRSILCHEIGVTERYNVILDFPVIVDPARLFLGGPLIKYEKESFARIGVMPRYGDAESVHWFEVEPCCAFHIINCYEEGDEVVVMACRAEDSILPGPPLGLNKFEWFSRGFKPLDLANKDGFLLGRPCMWRLNMKTGLVDHNYLLGTDQFAMDFPMINGSFTGIRNRYAYAQVVDSISSSSSGKAKYSGLAKLYLEERNLKLSEVGKKEAEETKVEYHMFPENTFCTGSTFVTRREAIEEDDGWLITFVHNETTNTSQVYIIDAKSISGEPVAIITLPYRVPYGFHGAFIPLGDLDQSK